MKKVAETLVVRLGFTALIALLGGIALIHLAQFQTSTQSLDSNLVSALSLCAAAFGIIVVFLLRGAGPSGSLASSGTDQALPLAAFDTMTGIPNRFLFEDRMSGVLAEGHSGAIFLIDLSNFGRVNDRRGRSFGDVILKELAHRLRFRAEEENGLAARLGGDRFALYLPNVRRQALDELCKDLVEVCQAPVSKGGDVVSPHVSVGAVALAEVEQLRALGYDAVLSVCNFALTSAKKQDGKKYCIYDKTLEQRFLDLDAMAAELPEALRAGDLEVFLQPRVRLENGALIGFEALVRWKRLGSYVSAEELVLMAEETGLIYDLDTYMIDRAIQVMADWNRRRKTSYPVSVNLSALHLGREAGVEFIADCLTRHQFPPELLTIEITETANLSKWQHFEGLSGLRDIGCRIAIDDFGTGYASLARLRVLPANEIKIDRMLVAELIDSEEARIILDAVLTLAKNLKMDVVAEGIENDAQIHLLFKMGCRHGQGYIFGKPRPALDWLADATYGPADAA